MAARIPRSPRRCRTSPSSSPRLGRSADARQRVIVASSAVVGRQAAPSPASAANSSIGSHRAVVTNASTSRHRAGGPGRKGRPKPLPGRSNGGRRVAPWAGRRVTPTTSKSCSLGPWLPPHHCRPAGEELAQFYPLLRFAAALRASFGGRYDRARALTRAQMALFPRRHGD